MGEEEMSKQEEHDDSDEDLMRKLMLTLIYPGKLAPDKSDENYAQRAFEELIEIIKDEPNLFLPHLKELFQYIYLILDKPEFEEKTKFLAKELMELLLLHYRYEGPVVIETGKFLSRIFAMLTAIDDDPDWDGNDNFDDDSRVYIQGVKRLARFAPVIGGQYILEKFCLLIDWHYFSQQWQSRHAAVISHSIISNNCPKVSASGLICLSISFLYSEFKIFNFEKFHFFGAS